MEGVTPRQLAARRLATLGVTTTGRPAPDRVVGSLVAVQGQDYAMAKWAVGQRSAGGVDDVRLEALLDAGTLLRTHVLRPTWHVVRSDDIRWLLALTGPRVVNTLAGYCRRLGVGPEVLSRGVEIIGGAVRGGRHRTVEELAAIVAGSGITVDRLRLGHLLMQAELEAVICSGARRGRHATYALMDERVPASPLRDRDDAAVELALRYFAGHGPATVDDFSWWSGLTLTDARRAVGDAADGLQAVVVDDVTYWCGSARPATPAPVALLPTFDEFVVGYRSSRWLLDTAGTAGMTGPDWPREGHPVVVDSQVVGRWRRRLSAGRVTVEITADRPLTGSARDELVEVAGRLGRFVGLTPSVVFRP